jgi:hypothetical protein
LFFLHLAGGAIIGNNDIGGLEVKDLPESIDSVFEISIVYKN